MEGWEEERVTPEHRVSPKSRSRSSCSIDSFSLLPWGGNAEMQLCATLLPTSHGHMKKYR